MQWTRVGALVAILGCHHAARTPPVAKTAEAPPPPAGFDSADFVTLEATGALTAWQLAEGHAVRLGSVPLGVPLTLESEEARALAVPMHGDWADADHLFVRVGPGVVKLVTTKGIFDVALPDLSAQVAKPDDAIKTSGGAGGKAYARIDLVVARGEAWWSQCPWTTGPDGGACAGWVSAQLWPTSTKIVQALIEPRQFSWEPVGPPQGYALKHEGIVSCNRPDGGSSTVAPTPDDGDVIFDARWVSANPPQYLVLFGADHEYDEVVAERWVLSDCADHRITGTDPVPGPNGLWAGAEHDEIVIRRGGTVVGHLPIKDPHFARVLFRPLR
ncbi:MAG: hypothetical protein IPQ07_30050 [Myxococcales bacterium]|nr:hypothetical protein [Myxococcales bacterium]